MRTGIYILSGLLHVAIGFLLAGGGHGWTSGLYFSFCSFLVFCLIPFLPNKRKFNLGLLFFSLILSVLMLVETVNGGTAHFDKAWRAAPVLMILYFSFWFSWPLIALSRLTR